MALYTELSQSTEVGRFLGAVGLWLGETPFRPPTCVLRSHTEVVTGPKEPESDLCGAFHRGPGGPKLIKEMEGNDHD
jgi:hypothetical protein